MFNAPPDSYDTNGMVNGGVTKAGRPVIRSAVFYNGTGVDAYVFFWDRATIPTGIITAGNAPAPICIVKVPADNHGSFDFGEGIPLKRGLAVATSSTAGDYNAVSDNSFLITVSYRDKTQ